MTIRRRNYWIRPQFQGRMILHWSVLVLLATVLTYLLTIVAVIYQDRTGGGSYFYVKDLLGSDPVAIRRYQIALPVLLTSGLVSFLATCLAGVFYSHRIAGPVYRIQLALHQALEGKRPELIRLRKNDELKDLAEDLNRLFERLPQ